MKLSNTFATLVATVHFREVLGQGHSSPFPNEGLQSGTPLRNRDIQNLTFYSTTFYPQAPVVRFESTMIIPASSPDPIQNGHVQAVWPGVNNKTLLQNVMTNTGGVGEWFTFPFFCCTTSGHLANQSQVYPGDSLTTTYLWDQAHNKWLDSWVSSPGDAGVQAGSTGFIGGITFDPNIAPGHDVAMDTASLNIELQDGSTWDFGPIIWQNILVVAQTTDDSWCTKPSVTDNMNFQMSVPTSNTANGTTTCYIASMVFTSPTKFGN
ncbi:hypothetical protein G7Y89_g6289 [Cudoniella acicularis]|uniref:Uncharacterized protein n=1 Tax=Cudoniella acicularis TaxID=354080 RepID=A0A8H4RN13_9HELO|nr:hypothetical protein G7Y89_g6289 [Cudoniella acicularis]